MFHMKKRISAMALAAFLSLSSSTGVMAQETKSNTVVEYNGVTVDFDSTPITIDNSVYVPLSTMEALLGDSLTADVKTSVTKKAENGMDYVAVRSLADQLGITLVWDQATQTIGLLDLEKLLAEYQNDFTMMDKYMAYSKTFAEKAYKAEGTFDFTLSMNKDGALVPLSVTGKFTGLSENLTANMDIAMEMKLEEFIAALQEDTEELTQEDKDMLDQVKNISMSIILDLQSGKYYLQSPLFTTTLGVPENSWIEVNLNDLFEQSGMNFSFGELMQTTLNGSFLDTIENSMKMLPVGSIQDIHMIRKSLEIMKKIYGDDAFQKVENGYRATYTDNSNAMMSVTMTLDLLADANDTINGYGMDMVTKMAGADFMNIHMLLDSNMKMACQFSISVPEAMSMEFKLDGTYTETKEKVKTAPEANSQILPFADLLKDM